MSKNNYCKFTDDKKEKDCNCNEYCPSKECIDFLKLYDKNGNNNAMHCKEIETNQNNIEKLKKELKEIRKKNSDNRKKIVKKDNKKLDMLIRNDMINMNQEKSGQSDDNLLEFIEKKNKEKEFKITEFDKLIQILSLDTNPEKIYEKLNRIDESKNMINSIPETSEQSYEDIEYFKNLLINKIDKLREEYEIVKFDDKEYRKTMGELKSKERKIIKNIKNQNKLIKEYTNSQDILDSISSKSDNDLNKLDNIIVNEKNKFKDISEKIGVSCAVKKKQCPDYFKKIIIALTIFMILIYYTISKLS